MSLMIRHSFLLIVFLFALSLIKFNYNESFSTFIVATTDTELIKIENLKYEDHNITIKFDFWSQGGK